MKKDKITNFLKEKNIVVPLYIYRLFPKLDISLDELFFLLYLSGIDEKIIFNPQKLADELGKKVSDILNYVDKLSTKGFVGFEIIKNEKGVSEEYLSLSNFYEKISMLVIEESNEKPDSDSKIFEKIEKEFGRVLSPIEYEIIKAWGESGFTDELITEALKEAVFNGVSNLRYIDKILYEWQKKGIKTKEDIENNRKKFKNKQEKVEVFEYNWLEDDE